MQAGFVKAVDLEKVKVFDLESKRTVGLPKVLLDQIREKMISISNQVLNYTTIPFISSFPRF